MDRILTPIRMPRRRFLCRGHQTASLPFDGDIRLQQLGGAFYVEPLFNGLCLLMAIGLAGFAGRRRVALRKKEELVQRDPKHPLQPQ